jgi:hypothetical protein
MNACTKGGKCCDNHRKIGPAKKGRISKRVYQSNKGAGPYGVLIYTTTNVGHNEPSSARKKKLIL